MNHTTIEAFFRTYRDRYQSQLDSGTLNHNGFTDMYAPTHSASEKAKAVHDLPRVQALFRQMTRKPDAQFLHLDLERVHSMPTKPGHAIVHVTWILGGVTHSGEELEQEVTEFFSMGLIEGKVVILGWVMDKEEEQILMRGRGKDVEKVKTEEVELDEEDSETETLVDA